MTEDTGKNEGEKEERTFTCINCPMGCTVEAVTRREEIVSIEGNICKAGENYVQQELENPTRVLTGTVKVKGGILPRIPIKSEGPIPKSKVKAATEELADVELEAPVELHQVIIENIKGTEINVITTRPMPEDH